MKKYYIILIFFFPICLYALQIDNPNPPSENFTSLQDIISGIQIASNNDEVMLEVNIQAVEADTLHNNNKISKIWSSKAGQYTVELELSDYSVDIRLSVFNMLGKEVMEIHDGPAKSRGLPYTFEPVTLPNGIYICVLQGHNFKDGEKFIVSR